jgi:DNA invertase Pin-like site-specific DNA recombinase
VAKRQPLNGYVRVSRVAGREGDSFISPRVQRQKIEAWAKLHDVVLGEIVEELDVSGGRAPSERKLETLLKRCESGASGGIVCWRVDRFSRSAADTLAAVKRLQACGARLVGVDDGMDSAAPGGKLVLTVLAGLAEAQLDQASENWRTARREASKRGVYLTGHPPTGYARGEDGSLIADADSAAVILEAYRLRANGGSYQDVADLLANSGVLPAAGVRKDGVQRTSWSREGARQLLRNPLYRGEPRGSNAEASVEAIVSPELWAAANFTTRSYAKGSGRTRALLIGLAVCGGCGHAVHATGDGPSYTCRGKFASGPCPARVVASCARVDDYVLFMLQQPEVQEQISDGAANVEARYIAARDAVQLAEAELEAFVLSASAVERELFTRGVEVRQTALDEARRTFYELDDPGVPEGVPVVYFGDQPLLLEGWDEMGIDRQRQHLRRLIKRVVIHRADPTRRKHQPIWERIEVTWR